MTQERLDPGGEQKKALRPAGPQGFGVHRTTVLPLRPAHRSARGDPAGQVEQVDHAI